MVASMTLDMGSTDFEDEDHVCRKSLRDKAALDPRCLIWQMPIAGNAPRSDILVITVIAIETKKSPPEWSPPFPFRTVKPRLVLQEILRTISTMCFDVTWLSSLPTACCTLPVDLQASSASRSSYEAGCSCIMIHRGKRVHFLPALVPCRTFSRSNGWPFSGLCEGAMTTV